jgi:hypothetical protein
MRADLGRNGRPALQWKLEDTLDLVSSFVLALLCCFYLPWSSHGQATQLWARKGRNSWPQLTRNIKPEIPCSSTWEALIELKCLTLALKFALNLAPILALSGQGKEVLS